MPDAPAAPNPVQPPPSAPRDAGAAPQARLRWLVRATAVAALVGVVAALLGLAWSARPLETPTQDCGTAFTFLVAGRVNEFVDPADPPEGVSRAQAEANNDEPCQERAADRARPAGALVVSGTALALVALATESTARFAASRRARRSPDPDNPVLPD